MGGIKIALPSVETATRTTRSGPSRSILHGVNERALLFRLSTPPIDGGFGYPAGFAAATLTTLAAVVAGATTRPWIAVATLSGVAAVTAAVTTLTAAVATAAVCWGMHTGFVLNRRGELLLTTPAVTAAIVLAAVTLLGYVVATTTRALRGRTVRRVLTIPTQRGASTPRIEQPRVVPP